VDLVKCRMTGCRFCRAGKGVETGECTRDYITVGKEEVCENYEQSERSKIMNNI